MKSKHFYSIILIITIAFLGIAAISEDKAGDGEKSNKDVIKFSHEVHSEVSSCADCHTNVAGSEKLTDRLLPGKPKCAECHDVEDTDNCNMCHYEDVLEPLIQKKSDLMFNHKYHVTEQKQECESCHKGLSEVDYSFKSASLNPPMSNCYQCHNGVTVASNECESCHISTVDLLPQDHKQVAFNKNHKFAAGSSDANCQMCHDDEFCGTCHVGTTALTETNSSGDFYAPYSPHKFLDNTKKQQLTRVHDLNYRFTHGIDLKGKTTECQTCHQIETFCAECHDSKGGDFALGGMTPSSHSKPGFIMLGVGSGGGEHSILAKRDIERCASCHDLQGSDPSCIVCHADNDGIKGTNPKTHALSYMRSEHGDWHTDQGSVCYNCHTDANARPGGNRNIGFCGYCHN